MQNLKKPNKYSLKLCKSNITLVILLIKLQFSSRKEIALKFMQFSIDFQENILTNASMTFFMN